MKISRAPNDPLFAPAGPSSGMWFLDRISAPAAWDVTTGSSDIGVCVIDTGARTTHEDLAGNIRGGWNWCAAVVTLRLLAGCAEGWPAAPAATATPCCDVSCAPPLCVCALRCRAWKCTTYGPTYTGCVLGSEYTNYTDTSGHGSHTAGSVGAVGDNGVGVTGVAWNVSLYICKASRAQEQAEGAACAVPPPLAPLWHQEFAVLRRSLLSCRRWPCLPAGGEPRRVLLLGVHVQLLPGVHERGACLPPPALDVSGVCCDTCCCPRSRLPGVRTDRPAGASAPPVPASCSPASAS